VRRGGCCVAGLGLGRGRCHVSYIT
jgi:hypothetical protein